MNEVRYIYPEAAEILRVEETWLRRHIKKLPHSKKGRVVTFSSADLDAIDAQFHHSPTSGPLVTAGPTSGGVHPLASLRPLPGRGSLRRA
ncbi:helix-turn-helix domain-containing protein [Streptomyces sp. NPDC053048]|uniref:helix-turn-helix domain-containing protein n=1 Tax=Streptomyces sp. NPDC053048 TaxID=3365694 RepID=UPI0037D050DE